MASDPEESKAGAEWPGSAIETELKFAMPRRYLGALSASPILRAVPSEQRSLRSTYFDTEDNALRNAGYVLRVREGEGGFVQTLKSDGAAPDGLLSRGEAAWQVEGLEPDTQRLRGLLPDELHARIEHGLKPRFVIFAERTIWQIEQGETAVDVTYDEGAAKCGTASEPISEVEIELRRGPPQGLFGIARDLANVVPLRLDFTTKSERGYRLIEAAGLDAVKAAPVVLAAGITVGESFRLLASQCIHQFAVNEAVLLATGAPEPLHQMRVAVRRFRSLAGFCRDLFTDDERETIRAESRRLFQSLGSVRDLDILIGALAGGGAPEPLDSLRRERQAALSRALSMLRSRRFCTRMIELLALVECGDAARQDDPARAAFAGRRAKTLAIRIFQRHWKALRRSRRLSKLDPESRHRVRIRTKKFRYACDFYGTLFPLRRKRHRKVLKAVGALQDALGELNDRSSILQLVEQRFGTGVDLPAREPGTTGDEALLQRADAARRKLRRLKPFWT